MVWRALEGDIYARVISTTGVLLFMGGARRKTAKFAAATKVRTCRLLNGGAHSFPLF